MEDVATAASRNFGRVFQSQMLWLESLDDLIGEAAAVAPEAPRQPGHSRAASQRAARAAWRRQRVRVESLKFDEAEAKCEKGELRSFPNLPRLRHPFIVLLHPMAHKKRPTRGSPQKKSNKKVPPALRSKEGCSFRGPTRNPGETAPLRLRAAATTFPTTAWSGPSFASSCRAKARACEYRIEGDLSAAPPPIRESKYLVARAVHRHLSLDAAEPPHGSGAGKSLQAGQGRRRRLLRTRPGRLLLRVGVRARTRRLAWPDDPQPGRDAGARLRRARHHAAVHGQGRFADLGTRRLVALWRLAAAQRVRADFDAGRTDRRDGRRLPGRAACKAGTSSA